MGANSTQTSNLTACADIARGHDFERWLAVVLAPRAARAGLATLIAFNAEVSRTREAVSEPMLGQIRLQWWREAVEGSAAGNPRAHPVAEGLATLLAEGRVAPDDLTALVDAREIDLDPDRIQTPDDFHAYCDATAGAFNRAALKILGIDDTPTGNAARHTAIATAITGQLRAVNANAARGRVLLARKFLENHGVTAADIVAGKRPPGLVAAARDLAASAERHIDAARRFRRGVPTEALCVLVGTRIAESHVARLKRAGYDLFSDRLEPAPVTVPLIVLRAMVTGRY